MVFGVGEDPVKLGLVESLARPGGNATGINFFAHEVAAKRLGLLHELVPKAARIAVLVNPTSPSTAEPHGTRCRKLLAPWGCKSSFSTRAPSARSMRPFLRLRASEPMPWSSPVIGFFTSRRVQFATLAARDRVPAGFVSREFVEAGGLMSYGTNIADMFRQAGIYTGSILKGAKPADLPVLQATKFEFLINLNTAKALGLEVPPMLLARADEVIE